MTPARLVALIFCTFFLLISTGCLAPVTPAHALPGHSWKLVSYNVKERMTTTDPGVMITMKFGPGGLISGSIGCNRYYGTYHYEGEILTLNNLESTARNCDDTEGIGELEDHYFELLNKTTRFSVVQNSLTLSHFDENKLLVFERHPF